MKFHPNSFGLCQVKRNKLDTFQGLAVLPDCSTLQDEVPLTGKFKEPLALVYSEFTSPEAPLNDHRFQCVSRVCLLKPLSTWGNKHQ